MGILKKLARSITKVVSFTLRKIGQGIQQIAARIASYGIDIKQPPLIKDLRASIITVDKYGTYSNLGLKEKVPKDMMVETDESMRRRYRTLYEVKLVNPYSGEKIIKYSSIYHDYNIPDKDLKKRLEEMIFAPHESSYQLDYYVEDMQRVLVWHRAGDEY